MFTAFEGRGRPIHVDGTQTDDRHAAATREAVRSLAAWAADRIGLGGADRVAYADSLIGALAGGAIEHDIATAVGADIERADRKAENPIGEARAVLHRALTEAGAIQSAPPRATLTPAVETSRRYAA